MDKILLIEDETSLVTMYKILLEAKGYEVITSRESNDAYALAKEHHPALIFLDLVFPKTGSDGGVQELSKKTGFGLLQALKADSLTKDIPVVVLTNLGSEDDETRAEELGAIDFVIKSKLLPRELINKIDKWLK
jgi:DNA-binding response OmpR family regulator